VENNVENGQLLNEIYNKVNDIHTNLAVLTNEHKRTKEIVDKHEEQIEKIKWRILPVIGIVSMLMYILATFLKRG
jgi:hypothetical protein